MTIGSFGELAYGELPAEYDNSVANPFRTLLEDPEAQLMFLIELYPYDAAGESILSGEPAFGSAAFGEYDIVTSGAEQRIFLSDMGFITEPADDPDNQYFSPSVDNPLQFEASILQGDDFGSQIPSFGAITIKNGSEFDTLETYYWKGRRIVVKAGSKDFSYADFATVFDGTCNDIEADDDQIILTISDNRQKLEQLLTPGAYAGTGGIEGGDDLAGKPKPLCYGQVFNIEPVLVDAVNLVYQIHDGSISAVDAVRDSGVVLTSGGNVADITAAVVSAGQYKTQISGGYIKLGSTPAGRITADVHGDSTGGYISTAGAIAQRLVKTRLGARSLSSSQIDAGAFNLLDAALPAATGIYLTEQTYASEAIDALINPNAAYWTFTRRGLLTAGAIDEPGTEDLILTEDDIDDPGIRIAAVMPPAWRISVGYAPVGVVQKEDELAAATTDDDRAFVGQEHRFVVNEDRAVRTINEFSLERQFLTRLSLKSDAEDLLERLVRIFGQRRRVYRVPLLRAMFRGYLGDTVKLSYPRYGLNDGVKLLVVGVSEDAETGGTVLELWG